MFADLHLHTHFSDGTYLAGGIGRRTAQRHGFAAHRADGPRHGGRLRAHGGGLRGGGHRVHPRHGTDGRTRRQRTAPARLFPRHRRTRSCSREIAKFQDVRQNRIREMVARLNELDIPLQADAVFALANCRSPGRPHVARALVQGRPLRQPGRSLRALSEKGPARLGAQVQDVRRSKPSS